MGYQEQHNKIQSDLDCGKLRWDDLLNQANELLKGNDTENAYPLVCVLAESDKANADDTVTAGLLAVSLNEKESAEKYFKLALTKDPDNFNASYNLALLKMEEEDYKTGLKILKGLDEKNSRNCDLKNDLAVVSLRLNNDKDALDYWNKSLTIDPNFSIARNNLMEYYLKNGLIEEAGMFVKSNINHENLNQTSKAELNRWMEIVEGSIASPSIVRTGEDAELTGKKIVIFASIDTFINDIKEKLSENNEVKMFKSGSLNDMESLMKWADIAWFEWCDNFLIQATKLSKSCRIICRLHSYEAFTEMPAQVDWDKVDLLIFVNQSVCDIFRQQIKTRTPVKIIHNAVDDGKFTIPDDKAYGKKIASVGYINYKKNPALLLYCFKKIYEYDNEYTLHIAGVHQDSRIQLYFDHFLKENPLPIQFEGWIDNMADWYADKDFIISTSLFESFHYSIAEGMASGLMPLIHNWYGARYLYPHQFMFNDPDDCLKLVQELEGKDRYKLSLENREFIKSRYALTDKNDEILKALSAVSELDNASLKEKMEV